jgi:polar amino acid transport system permease protein
MELTYQARQVESYTFRGFEAFTAATLVYVVISLIITGMVTLYSRKILTPMKAH